PLPLTTLFRSNPQAGSRPALAVRRHRRLEPLSRPYPRGRRPPRRLQPRTLRQSRPSRRRTHPPRGVVAARRPRMGARPPGPARFVRLGAANRGRVRRGALGSQLDQPRCGWRDPRSVRADRLSRGDHRHRQLRSRAPEPDPAHTLFHRPWRTPLAAWTPALRLVLRSAGAHRKRLRATVPRAPVADVLLEVLAGVPERDLRAAGRAGDGLLESRDRGPRLGRRAAPAPRGDHGRGKRRGADRGRHDFLGAAQRDPAARQLRTRARLPAPLPVLRRPLALYQLKLT